MPQCLLPLIWLVDHPFGLLTPVDFSIYRIFFIISFRSLISLIQSHPDHPSPPSSPPSSSTIHICINLRFVRIILHPVILILNFINHRTFSLHHHQHSATGDCYLPVPRAGGVPGNFVSSRLLLWFALDSFLCTKQRLQRPLVVPLELPRTAQTEAVCVKLRVCVR